MGAAVEGGCLALCACYVYERPCASNDLNCTIYARLYWSLFHAAGPLKLSNLGNKECFNGVAPRNIVEQLG